MLCSDTHSYVRVVLIVAHSSSSRELSSTAVGPMYKYESCVVVGAAAVDSRDVLLASYSRFQRCFFSLLHVRGEDVLLLQYVLGLFSVAIADAAVGSRAVG